MTQPTKPDETQSKNPAVTQVATTTSDSDSMKPTSMIGWGLVLVIAAVGLYLYFTDLENRNATTSIPAVLALLYNTGGKNLVAVILGGLGAVSIFIGAVSWLRQER